MRRTIDAQLQLQQLVTAGYRIQTTAAAYAMASDTNARVEAAPHRSFVDDT